MFVNRILLRIIIPKYVNNYNVVNKNKTGTPSISTILIDNTVKLNVPKEYTKWYGSIIV